MAQHPQLNLRHLEAIVTAGRLGSISSASEAINLSQPALTQAVGRVEAQLGHLLFDRQPSGVTPTEAGRLITARIERALAYVARGGQAVRRGARLPPLPHIERRITAGQLRALISVDQAGSFALASRRAGLSEPALHRACRDLEQLLSVSLLVRQGRTVQPTAAAVILLRFARLAQAEMEAGLDELEALRSEGAGRVTVGTMPLARAILLPQALARFARAYPMASVNVVEGPYAELLARLREGEMDLLIGAMRNPPPVKDIAQEPLFIDDPVIVGRAGHPLLGEPGFPFSRLLDFPWVIAATGAPVRHRWEEMFKDHELEPPRLRIECGSVLVVRGLMLEDDWLTLMSRDQFLFERRAGLLEEIAGAGPSLRRQIGLTVRDDWRPTQLQTAFVDTFRTVCAEWTSGKAMDSEPFRYA
ncbi:LysR substrate-binding domain-containing protein [Rhizobium ruizarguesonis]|uniref:LysR substrate-binding domain-containing protein n=1 Tax=Rhizobium ruizarguesonis TaxID=2081791 RepID=UPI00102FFED2|nr:LysR substrate-binding domain-containing protein [Rhizobium ruizarguesonis]TBD82746.1 LysR family transcriptional regulator [Rhizobium ruizarguesonis]TBE13903.1 LysR family transcriptional regulator [Rhizobium ruizarguesonis]TBE25117.1 LysR family transcriptional regulator [Rhizobium ruizarguesonis]TBE34661.1 LysR family transcriptional regulator [Rhizobium ruizarguesonis]WSG99945.1 LysR substrate-binding domain-containing protein [Rhizobium ruizarguesonis]